MLYQIICDKFIKQPKIFNEGINVVLGDDNGSNSIGKSTFLMIVDFALGGDSYLELDRQTIEKVGNHFVKIVFLFDDIFFYFTRNTEEPNYVTECTSDFFPKAKWKKSEFLKWLEHQYSLESNISFRDSVGRYSRIYPKENLDEHNPLLIVKNENKSSAIISLLKIFNVFKAISDLHGQYLNLKENMNVLKASQKYNLVPSISKKEYQSNLKKMTLMQNEIEIIRDSILKQTTDIEIATGEEKQLLKNERTEIITSINTIKSSLNRIATDATGGKSKSAVEYEELAIFFQHINLEKVKEVDNFHDGISKIISNETKDFKKTLENNLEELINRENEIKNKLDKFSKVDDATQASLDKFSELEQELKKIENENHFYEHKSEMEKTLISKHMEFVEQQKKTIEKVQSLINNKLATLNKYIYEEQVTPPKLEINEKTYEYKTAFDNGTGTNFKNLILYDLAILTQTNLPIIIHDSVLFKNIQSDAMDKIASLYSQTGKQVFISFDKLSLYPQNIQQIFEKNAILKLSKGNKQELFGFSWLKEDIPEKA